MRPPAPPLCRLFHPPIISDEQRLTALLTQCTNLAAHHPLDKTPHRTIHARILRLGLNLSGTITSALVHAYANSAKLTYARNAFISGNASATTRNSILKAYARQEHPENLISAFSSMRSGSATTPPDQFSYAMTLSACAKTLNLNYGMTIHCDVVKTGFESYAHCQGSLIDLYAKCGSIADARRVFDGIGHPDTVSWTNMISGYKMVGMYEEALEVFDRMQEAGVVPDNVACVMAISACVGLGRLADATSIIAQMRDPSAVAWNMIISGYSKNGYDDQALRFYQDMRGSCVVPTRSTFGSVLSAAASVAAFDGGRQVHADSVRLGLDSNVYVGSSLINMYAKCGRMEDARRVFDTLDERNTVIWNALLGGYVQNSQPERVIELFFMMKGLRFEIDEFTFTSVFGACASLENISFGRQLHCLVIKSKFDGCLLVGNATIDMYAKCGEINDAKRHFELGRNRDHVSWNAIIVGHVHNEEPEEALNLFRNMRRNNVIPDEVSFASVISGCSSIQASEEGKQMHCLSIKFNLSSALYVGNSLIDLYAKLDDMDSANLACSEMITRGAVAMNVLITGHVQNNNAEEALNVFKQMQSEGLEPSRVTFASILPACTEPSGIMVGRQLHCCILKSGLIYSDEFVGSSLLGMYMKLKTFEEANKLFLEMEECRSLVIWTSFISLNARNGCSEDALVLFQRMRRYDLRPDQATFVSVLKSCADLAALKDGKQVHSLVIQTGFSSDGYSSSALVDMYSKCGDVGASLQVFHELENRANAISWNSMIVGFAKNGYAEEALSLFHEMQHSQAKPDQITLLGVLTACSHAGLVSEGRGFFESMPKKYGVTPRVDHCACIVDLLGRGGFLKEAMEFIDRLPFEPNGVIWAPFLAACKIHEDWERGVYAAEKLIWLEPHNSSHYVLLSSIYAASGKWSEAKMVRESMRERGVKKQLGCSWIEVGDKTSSFSAGDKFLPEAVDIHEALNDLTIAMKEDGYVAELECLLMDEE